MAGQHCINTWSSTQQFIALSSGESEYYGLIKAASSALGLQSIYADMDIKVDVKLLTDATAAKGIACRKGLSSRTRHVAVHFLWLQDKVAREEISIHKVWGQQNIADLLTKYVPRDKLTEFCNHINSTQRSGRSPLAPSVTNSIHSLQNNPPTSGYKRPDDSYKRQSYKRQTKGEDQED